MRIIIDVMGGDNAPKAILDGVYAASQSDPSLLFSLTGKEDIISDYLNKKGVDRTRFEIIPAGDIITMDDDPVRAVRRKKDASMVRGLRALSDGGGDAFVCAGNTGALFAGATLIVGRAPGVKRAAIGTIMPGTSPCLLLDAGANVTVTPEYLEQFAVIGSSYMQRMHGLDSPRVGILNNGTEEHKGTDLQIETAALLREHRSVNYIGFCEPNYVMSGICDVVICDGFTGNVYLKAVEGVGKRISGLLKDVYSGSLLTKLSYLAVRRRLKKMRDMFDASAYGGSPILGIRKPVITAHGSSDARAIANAVSQAVRFASGGICEDLGGM